MAMLNNQMVVASTTTKNSGLECQRLALGGETHDRLQ
jgi:hypothetical protein